MVVLLKQYVQPGVWSKAVLLQSLSAACHPKTQLESEPSSASALTEQRGGQEAGGGSNLYKEYCHDELVLWKKK